MGVHDPWIYQYFQLDNEMIDTVKLHFDVDVPDDLLVSWRRISNETASRDNIWTVDSMKYVLNTFVGNVLIKATYYPKNNRYPAPALRIEFSTPKLLYGENFLFIVDTAEVGAALLTANNLITQIPGLPNVDTREGILARLDIYYDHLVDDPDAYIRALFNLNYPQRDTRYYQNQGVKYMSAVIVTRFYNKGVESGIPGGSLRQEIEYRKGYYIERRLGIPNPTLMDVTKDWIESELEEDLRRLRLADSVIGNRDYVRNKLIEEHGRIKGNRLWHFLEDYQSKFRNEKLSDDVYGHRTIRRNLKEISDVGIVPTMIDIKETLPALTIDMDGKR